MCGVLLASVLILGVVFEEIDVREVFVREDGFDALGDLGPQAGDLVGIVVIAVRGVPWVVAWFFGGSGINALCHLANLRRCILHPADGGACDVGWISAAGAIL